MAADPDDITAHYFASAFFNAGDLFGSGPVDFGEAYHAGMTDEDRPLDESFVPSLSRSSSSDIVSSWGSASYDSDDAEGTGLGSSIWGAVSSVGNIASFRHVA